MIAIYAPPAASTGSATGHRACRDGRGCGPATAYQAGFEDSRYNQIYRNPFTLGSDAWHEYDAGHEDARRNAKEQRV